MIPRVKNAGTEAWRNPSYLKENITMFDEKIVEKVTQEILGADSQPMDEEQEHFGDGKCSLFSNSSMHFLRPFVYSFINSVFALSPAIIFDDKRFCVFLGD